MTKSIEYLAGLFDGEGSFSIQVSARHRRGSTTGWVNPSMSLNLYYGCDVLKHFVDRFGGQIYPYTKDEAPRGARWHLGRRVPLMAAVDAILPHLEIKRDIAVRFREALLLMPTSGRGPSRQDRERVWRNEQVLAVAEIALVLNPARSRKTNKTAEYVEILRGALEQPPDLTTVVGIATLTS